MVAEPCPRCAELEVAVKEIKALIPWARTPGYPDVPVSQARYDDLTARLASAEGERDSHWTELVRINVERNAFRDERDTLKAERDELIFQMDMCDQQNKDLKSAVEQAREFQIALEKIKTIYKTRRIDREIMEIVHTALRVAALTSPSGGAK